MDSITIIFDIIGVIFSTFMLIFGIRLLMDCADVRADKQDYVNAMVVLSLGVLNFNKAYLEAHAAITVIVLIGMVIIWGRRNGKF